MSRGVPASWPDGGYTPCMCGRYVLFTQRQKAARALSFGVRDRIDGAEGPRYNVAPGTHVPVILHREDEYEASFESVWWGYHPHWAGEKAPTPINARAEKIASSKYYSGAFSHHRCLVPADGWYEWLKTDDGKQPHFICREDRALIWLAGIWATRPDGEAGLAIITHEARGSAREVHDRMPLALGEDCLEDWLDPHMTERETIRQLIKPIPANTITHWAVSKEANRVGNDHADLVEPLNPA